MNRFVRNYYLFPLALVALSVPAYAAQIRQLEENDPSITYAGTWYTNNAAANSGGRSVLTNQLGASATISFRGTGISWIGVKDVYNGLAHVYLDGVLSTVESYADTTIYQQALYTVRGLDPGVVHTLSIEVTHIRDPNGAASWVWIDRFDIEKGQEIHGTVSASKGRAEQNDPAMTYTGTWFLDTNASMSGGTALFSSDPGSRATLAFNGAGVTWIGYRDEWSGIARVYVDGELTGTIDTYAPSAQAQATIYSVSNLSPHGVHTLTIEATGTHNAATTEAWVWVDAFDVTGH